MASNQPVEQDEADNGINGDDLPTYDNLAENHGPNSRFGRWRGWVEKRAAERYLDEDREARTRRRERGWGSTYDGSTRRESTLAASINERELPLPPAYSDDPPAPSPALAQGQPLGSTRVAMYSFGSRFLPHAQSPIRTLLPVMRDRFLLIGTSEGLSMLEMFPLSTGEYGQTVKGPSEAVQRELWHGEGVYQLALLESVEGAGDVPQGVVMALVGTEPNESSNEREAFRAVRMYNLSSLASLAAWSASQKEHRPLELHQPSKGNPSSLSKRHRPGASLTKSFKALVVDVPTDTRQPCHFPTQSPTTSPSKTAPVRGDSADSAEWDIVEDLPLRWATDYVPLASAGSKLASQSVTFFELWKNDVYGKGTVMLAIATKSQILLYESPRGERSFRFIKDFYTPIPAKKLSFVYQRLGDAAGESSGSRRSPGPGALDFGGKLCMFVVFEKKAGIIRLSDSTVCEVELYDEFPSARELASPATTTFRRSMAGIESIAQALKEHKSSWAVPIHISLPEPTDPAADSSSDVPQQRFVYMLTRGRATQILQSPLPNPINAAPPYHTIPWETQPSRIIPRVMTNAEGIRYLQVVGIGESGVEVQEIPLSFMSRGKGKGKGKQRQEQPVRVVEPVGVDAGFLCEGGMWDRQDDDSNGQSRGSSQASTAGDDSDTPSGIYAWCRKDATDWRVFWLGVETPSSVPLWNYI